MESTVLDTDLQPQVVADKAARLALSEPVFFVTQESDGKTFLHVGGDVSDETNWVDLG